LGERRKERRTPHLPLFSKGGNVLAKEACVVQLEREALLLLSHLEKNGMGE